MAVKRTFITRLMALTLGCIMLMASAPAVRAEATNKKQVNETETKYICQSASKDPIIESITIDNAKKVTGIKSSKKAVIEALDYSVDTKSQTKRIYNPKTGKVENKKINASTVTLYYLIKKTGTATLTYTVGNTTYKRKITVKKYTNPLKSLTVTGVNGDKNICSLLNGSNKAEGLKARTSGNLRIAVMAGNDWRIRRIRFSNTSDSSSSYVNRSLDAKYGGLVGTTLFVSGYDTKNNGALVIDLKNRKNGGTETVEVYINKN